jgi:hypothetical protein
MASHGVRRVKTTEDKLAEKLEQDKTEIAKLAGLMGQYKVFVSDVDFRSTDTVQWWLHCRRNQTRSLKSRWT